MFTSGFASSYDTSVSASHGHVRASSSNMPFIELQSNLPAGQFSEAFLKRLCSSTAAALGKPEDRMNVVVTPGLPMLMAGSTSPCVILSVSAIGVTDTAEKNKEHSAKIFEFLTKELDLSQDRIVIVFNALEPHQVGKKGTVMSFL
ncbi:D-dopachrome decarboxylase [Pundamilia nyererei]|uniref:D-dopachrome decarboxylase n=4 Tax=Haplochromini TaxID=319058 RepID=A0A3B4FBU1_9CICH|nr:D-dopachrome decarboxylase [Maylandia zebra]XP_005753332.1 PREDICTED: D-dopachrome decarboxylase-like [Pundamilia nyererei]XP_026027949.1 D-dopachrome decarboxylase-like [Astatotilapia calliptera]XP_039883179.1 D-dopachrome decarboxylase [Simochromis diagramma]